MRNPLAHIRTLPLPGRRSGAPQTVPADPRQVPNAAGGFGFVVDDRTRLRRFLTLGTDGGTYYAREPSLTRENADLVLAWARDRADELVAETVSVSSSGRAPRNTPALFALAAAGALGDATGRRAALDALPAVARTGTHLFQFAGFSEQFRGWGRGLRRAVGSWYLGRNVDDVAYQALKYRQREGWTHRDLLRLAHPRTDEPARRELFDWICRGTGTEAVPLVTGFLEAQAATDERQWLDVLARHPGLSWEMLPDAALTLPSVWEALVEAGLPQTALLRQLPRLTALGLLDPLGDVVGRVTAQLTDAERLRRARVHPVGVLVALRTYASGLGVRGGQRWEPVGAVVDALDEAFHAAFGSVEPTGKRTMLALDVSGSMASPVSGLPISCREASAALALVTAAVEPAVEVVGFTSTGPNPWSGQSALQRLAISGRQRLDDAVRVVSGLPFGGTDCALPMLHAAERRLPVDTFVVYTDNETWAGTTHPHEALRAYRDRMGIDARLVVVGMTATEVSIADPADAGMLDLAGFDAAAPALISDFSAGRL